MCAACLEIYPSATNERKAYLRIMAFLKTLRLYIRNRLRISGESSDWHLVFGVYFLQTWHFHCLGIVYMFLHTVIWFLRILESASTIALSKLEPPVTGSSSFLVSHMLVTLLSARRFWNVRQATPDFGILYFSNSELAGYSPEIESIRYIWNLIIGRYSVMLACKSAISKMKVETFYLRYYVISRRLSAIYPWSEASNKLTWPFKTRLDARRQRHIVPWFWRSTSINQWSAGSGQWSFSELREMEQEQKWPSHPASPLLAQSHILFYTFSEVMIRPKLIPAWDFNALSLGNRSWIYWIQFSQTFHPLPGNKAKWCKLQHSPLLKGLFFHKQSRLAWCENCCVSRWWMWNDVLTV